MIKWILISLSAFMAALAFVQPIWCAELVFVFLLPLFCATQQNKFLISYKEGFWWGIIFYSIYFYDLFRVIISKGHGLGRGVAILFLLVYASSYSAFWFGLAHKLCIFVKKYTHHATSVLWSWGSLTWLYFYWIDRAFFWIFGNVEGNQLNHPVVPLAVRPEWLYFLPFFGKHGFFLLVVIFSIISVLFLMHFSKKRILELVFCSLPFMVGWLSINPKKEIPPWVRNIGCIIPYTDDNNAWAAAEQIMFLLNDFQKKYSQISCIIMPESSFKFPLNEWGRCLHLWDFEKGSLLIGSHRTEGNELFNTLYQIKKGAILDYYDKCHTLFFTEQVPLPWSYFQTASKLFLHNQIPISQSKIRSKHPFKFLKKSFTPYICSDLFFIQENMPVHDCSLCIVNDSWFELSYIPTLMSLHAKVIALLFQTPIIYVGYRHCLFITPDGHHYLLPNLVG